MKTYHGRRTACGVCVTVEESGSVHELDPAPSQNLRNHSPGGFEWGYAGSGPAQLAMAILLDTTGSPSAATQHYQSFKERFVQRWPSEHGWAITEKEIQYWLDVKNGRPPMG